MQAFMTRRGYALLTNHLLIVQYHHAKVMCSHHMYASLRPLYITQTIAANFNFLTI